MTVDPAPPNSDILIVMQLHLYGRTYEADAVVKLQTFPVALYI